MIKHNMGWPLMTAIGFGGACLSIYTMSSLLIAQGTATIPLMVFGFIISLFSSFGYLELVLMYPNKIGGITTASADVLRPYNPLFANIAGASYWFAWLTAASFAAQYLATVIQQTFWQGASINWLATGLIVAVTIICLSGVRWVGRVLVPVAMIVILFAFGSILIPVLTGKVNWKQATDFYLVQTVPTFFGTITSLMAGVYLIGWSVPAYESALCYVGESKAPQKNVSRALFLSMGVAGLFFVISPIIWLGTIGPSALAKDLSIELWPVYFPLFGALAKICGACFVMFTMVACLFTPLLGPPRTLAQLSLDGFAPKSLGKISASGVPRNAMALTSFLAVLILWMGTPTWIIAATSFQYLLSISISSVAVWLLRRNEPNAPRPYRAPTVFIYLGLFSAMVWMMATVLGFQQYGLSTMIIGITFAFIGTPLYLWRKVTDRMIAGLPPFPRSLHLKLTGTMLAVLMFDIIGYLIAVHSLNQTDPHLNMLEDIFVVVALIAITVGLALPGMIVHAAEEVNKATKRLIKTNLYELSQAMEELGSGSLTQKQIESDIVPIIINSRDEIGEMAHSFNEMQEEIKKTVKSFNDVRQRLYGTMKELKELNETLEKRVVERTLELKESNQKLQNEIIGRNKMEQKVKTINDQLIVAARRAGMADIATSTLHNIGNVLTSVTTSVAMLQRTLHRSELENLCKLAEILHQHQDDMETFLTKDPKGQLVPSYIDALSEYWKKDKKLLMNEIGSLVKNIEHIINIIHTQQSLSEVIGMAEEVLIMDIVNDALILNKDKHEKINIIKKLNQSKTIIIDRVKLLQVIVNIIKNAIKSLLESKKAQKQLIFSLDENEDGFFQLTIEDNGAGISSQELKEAFSSGFTTTQLEQGASLHSTALAVTEMRGQLNVESKGTGLGTTFIISLPYDCSDKKVQAFLDEKTLY